MSPRSGAPLRTRHPLALQYLWREDQRKLQRSSFADKLREEWSGLASEAGIRPDQKCVHGHYLHEFYCDVCRLSPIDPDYNFNKYRTEIEKAIGFAKSHFTDPEGRKNLKDMKQAIDMEMWRASKHYGDKMNELLAYKVAENAKNKFIKELIEHTSGLTEVPKDAPPRVVEPLIQENAQGEEFIPCETDAKDMPRPEDREASDEAESQRAWTDKNIASLRTLVSRWYGDKKKVALAMLKPGFTVRTVDGVPKSTVARIRSVVLAEFRKYL